MMARNRPYRVMHHANAKWHRQAAFRNDSSPRTRPARRGPLAERQERLPFAPPEDWHEPAGSDDGYRVVAQPPGKGYRHVVTAGDVRSRLETLPAAFTRPLEVVQLSCMTRKKTAFPCYGMQWGTSLYLYPIEETLVETYYHPPRPALINEVEMFGGRLSETSLGVWTLHWTEQAIRDFYLNNILIHELGHLLDDRNSSYAERERFAEWFAIEYGYRRTGGINSRRPRRRVRKRHHCK